MKNISLHWLQGIFETVPYRPKESKAGFYPSFVAVWRDMSTIWPYSRRRGSRGGQGGFAPPPSPQKIAPPNSQARIQGAKRALPPPYKFLDPPMYSVAISDPVGWVSCKRHHFLLHASVSRRTTGIPTSIYVVRGDSVCSDSTRSTIV